MEFDREYIQAPGQSSSISTDKIDAHVKRKLFATGKDYYAYLSPRFRHDRFGYFENSLALRVGAGRRFAFERGVLVSLDLGTGYREARKFNGDRVTESLMSASASLDWKITEMAHFKFLFTHEQGAIERYQTFELSLKNKLSSILGLKYRITYTRDYPFSSLGHAGEVVADIGLSYSF